MTEPSLAQIREQLRVLVLTNLDVLFNADVITVTAYDNLCEVINEASSIDVLLYIGKGLSYIMEFSFVSPAPGRGG